LPAILHGQEGHAASSRAFSLLETLVAVAIFAIAIVAIIEGIAANSRTQAWIESESRAVMLAQNTMEEVEYVGDLRVGSDSGNYEGDDSRYGWTSEVLDGGQDGLYEVRVTVNWSEGEAQRDFRLVTYMRKTDSETSTTLQQTQ
jgi:type II secretion system protein I